MVITVNETPNQAPTVTAEANPTSGKKPLTVQFNADASDPDGVIVSYLWSFGDGSTSSEQSPSHTYGRGTYTAIITVTDDDGAQAVDSVVIVVTAGKGQSK